MMIKATTNNVIKAPKGIPTIKLPNAPTAIPRSNNIIDPVIVLNPIIPKDATKNKAQNTPS